MIYPVNEIFETIQGEATFTGMPSVFVRLQRCPVGCPWCDTKHTWERNPEDCAPLSEIVAKTAASARYADVDVFELLDQVLKYRAKHIVLTGGEPALYDLRPLTDALLSHGRTVQVETSGTHMLQASPGTWVTVSPKVGMPGGYEVRDTMLWMANELKFPVGKQRDVELAVSLSQKAKPTAPIWLQPLSMSEKATALCMSACIEHGFRLSVQTHQLIGAR